MNGPFCGQVYRAKHYDGYVVAIGEYRHTWIYMDLPVMKHDWS